jgi:AraC family transcriptional regulator, regulatory protein of adaptative response / DNA-3-methyladenine glycosylase II
MDLDPVRSYRAFLSHDRRFDGRVFCGVVTTGVYCRPICPVRPAKFENTRYFACAAAAEAAGFRPCMRCRPETAPGTPAWMGTSAIVSRAMRLISEGALDGGDVEALASRVGVGGRQLRRLFGEHLGASPADIARARRVHFARKLIDETDLPFREVAASAGFQSVRQFNHSMRATFRKSPRTLREKRKSNPGAGTGLVLRLPFRPPLDWTALVDFLSARATSGVEVVTSESNRRTVSVGEKPGFIEVRPAPGNAHLVLTAHLPEYDGLLDVVGRVRRVFDLDSDPVEVERHLRKSADLRDRVAHSPGLRVPGAWHPFELAVRAILGQQVTVRGATTLAGRLAGEFGEAVDCGPDLVRLFPTARALERAAIERIGVPKSRADALRALARSATAGDLDFSNGRNDVVERLCSIPGVGPWTAEYVAMRALGEPDAFPASDLGVRRALGKSKHPVSTKEAERRAEAWRPWRSYAVLHLWRA